MNRVVCPVIVLLCMGGCAVPRDAGFSDVRKLLGDRGIASLHWSRGDGDDGPAAARVRELLSRDLTVDTATEVALLANPRLQATYERLGVAQADVVQAGLLRNPSIGGHVGIPIDKEITEWEASITFPLIDALLIPLRKRLAKREFERVKLEVADAVLDVVAEARSAFFTAQAAEQLAALERTLLEAAQASAELAQRQYAAGNLNELDVSIHQAMYAQAKLDAARAELRRLAERERLSRVLGAWGAATAWTVAPSLPELPKSEPPLDHLESFAVAHRLDLLAAERDVEARAAALRLTKSARVIGGLDVGAAAHQDADGPRTIGPTLTLEIPLFDQKQAEIARLQSELRASRRRADALAIAIRSQVRDARNRMLAARDTVEYYRATLIPLRERIVRLSLRHYDAMLLGVYQLLAAKQSEVGAYHEYIESVRDYWIARSDLERAAGAPIGEATK